MPGKNIKRLFLAHGREVQAYLTRKLRDAETAADLTQETFIRFMRQSGGAAAGTITHERSYLYRTAHNLAVDHIRREGREKTAPAPDTVLTAIPDEAPSAEYVLGMRGELARVRAALRELPERTQQIFVLARVEGLTYRAVAKELGISESSVQKHLAKALQHVMQALREPPGTS